MLGQLSLTDDHQCIVSHMFSFILMLHFFQISYGEMIGCDNDLCPIEWFHFSCVQLTNKPKGKWFCPKCRGDKPTTMYDFFKLVLKLEIHIFLAFYKQFLKHCNVKFVSSTIFDEFLTITFRKPKAQFLKELEKYNKEREEKLTKQSG